VKWPRLTAAAYRDLAEATVYFASQSREAATAFVNDLERALEQIQQSPRLFGRLETNDSDREIRRVVLQRFTYLVIYEIYNEIPEILAVMHASQQPDSWRLQEGAE
jgi:plasmid stabilization system protein ParE